MHYHVWQAMSRMTVEELVQQLLRGRHDSVVEVRAAGRPELTYVALKFSVNGSSDIAESESESGHEREAPDDKLEELAARIRIPLRSASAQ